MDRSFTSRSVNEGFSGGEKKRCEILQMAMLEPKYAVLDETDSGLDIDALRIVSEGVNALRSPNRGFLVITHYQRLLNYIVPDKVHVMVGGRIVMSGDKDLALELEAKGYDWVTETEPALAYPPTTEDTAIQPPSKTRSPTSISTAASATSPTTSIIPTTPASASPRRRSTTFATSRTTRSGSASSARTLRKIPREADAHALGVEGTSRTSISTRSAITSRRARSRNARGMTCRRR